MATSVLFSSSPPLSFSCPSNASQNSHFFSTKPLNLSFPLSTQKISTRNSGIQAGDGDMLGDFGARDPFPAEIESQFGEKVLGNLNTEHKILIPNLAALSLASLNCSPPHLQTPISEEQAQQLLRKVIGWRLITEEGILKLQCIWKLKDFKSGVDLVNRIYTVVEGDSHYPNLHLEQPNQIRAQLWTTYLGGLSMNDFIVAARIDGIKTSDLVPRKRVWA